ETPEVCDSRWRTLTPALPRAANSGQYLATGASRSRSPRSMSKRAASVVIALVVENTLVIVSSAQGTVRASLAQPPHRSTTISPSRITASEAPRSSPEASLAANSSRSGSNRALHVPLRTVGYSPIVVRSLEHVVQTEPQPHQLRPQVSRSEARPRDN